MADRIGSQTPHPASLSDSSENSDRPSFASSVIHVGARVDLSSPAGPGRAGGLGVGVVMTLPVSDHFNLHIIPAELALQGGMLPYSEQLGMARREGSSPMVGGQLAAGLGVGVSNYSRSFQLVGAVQGFAAACMGRVHSLAGSPENSDQPYDGGFRHTVSTGIQGSVAFQYVGDRYGFYLAADIGRDLKTSQPDNQDRADQAQVTVASAPFNASISAGVVVAIDRSPLPARRTPEAPDAAQKNRLNGELRLLDAQDLARLRALSTQLQGMLKCQVGPMEPAAIAAMQREISLLSRQCQALEHKIRKQIAEIYLHNQNLKTHPDLAQYQSRIHAIEDQLDTDRMQRKYAIDGWWLCVVKAFMQRRGPMEAFCKEIKNSGASPAEKTRRAENEQRLHRYYETLEQFVITLEQQIKSDDVDSQLIAELDKAKALLHDMKRILRSERCQWHPPQPAKPEAPAPSLVDTQSLEELPQLPAPACNPTQLIRRTPSAPVQALFQNPVTAGEALPALPAEVRAEAVDVMFTQIAQAAWPKLVEIGLALNGMIAPDASGDLTLGLYEHLGALIDQCAGLSVEDAAGRLFVLLRHCGFHQLQLKGFESPQAQLSYVSSLIERRRNHDWPSMPSAQDAAVIRRIAEKSVQRRDQIDAFLKLLKTPKGPEQEAALSQLLHAFPLFADKYIRHMSFGKTPEKCVNLTTDGTQAGQLMKQIEEAYVPKSYSADRWIDTVIMAASIGAGLVFTKIGGGMTGAILNGLNDGGKHVQSADDQENSDAITGDIGAESDETIKLKKRNADTKALGAGLVNAVSGLLQMMFPGGANNPATQSILRTLFNNLASSIARGAVIGAAEQTAKALFDAEVTKTPGDVSARMALIARDGAVSGAVGGAVGFGVGTALMVFGPAVKGAIAKILTPNGQVISATIASADPKSGAITVQTPQGRLSFIAKGPVTTVTRSTLGLTREEWAAARGKLEATKTKPSQAKPTATAPALESKPALPGAPRSAGEQTALQSRGPSSAPEIRSPAVIHPEVRPAYHPEVDALFQKEFAGLSPQQRQKTAMFGGDDGEAKGIERLRKFMLGEVVDSGKPTEHLMGIHTTEAANFLRSKGLIRFQNPEKDAKPFPPKADKQGLVKLGNIQVLKADGTWSPAKNATLAPVSTAQYVDITADVLETVAPVVNPNTGKILRQKMVTITGEDGQPTTFNWITIQKPAAEKGYIEASYATAKPLDPESFKSRQ